MKSLSGSGISCLLLAMMLPGNALGQDAFRDDQGTLVVSVRDRVVATESFSFKTRGDSVEIRSRAELKLPSGDRRKNGTIIIGRHDFGLRSYVSNDSLPDGHVVIRGVSMTPGDTAFTVFREVDMAGEADRLVLPPGRLFVLDPNLFVLFDTLVRSLQSQTFTSRPINLVTLSDRDTVLEGTATDLGRETLRWGNRPVQARKLQFSDGSATFIAWAHPDGRMLRLEHAPSGLRVERQPPPIKKRASPPKNGG